MSPPNPPLVKGVHRTAFDLPVDLWNELVRIASASGQKPTTLVRAWLAERVEAEIAAAKKTKRTAP